MVKLWFPSCTGRQRMAYVRPSPSNCVIWPFCKTPLYQAHKILPLVRTPLLSDSYMVLKHEVLVASGYLITKKEQKVKTASLNIVYNRATVDALVSSRWKPGD